MNVLLKRCSFLAQLSWVLEQQEPSSSSDDLAAVRNHTDQMLCLLAEERPAESAEGGPAAGAPMGPILELVVTENILERLVQWHLRRGLDPDSQGALLKLFEMLIGQSQQPLLQHTAVLHPLLRLLGACADPDLGCPLALENSLVLLLNQVRPPGLTHNFGSCLLLSQNKRTVGKEHKSTRLVARQLQETDR